MVPKGTQSFPNGTNGTNSTNSDTYSSATHGSVPDSGSESISGVPDSGYDSWLEKEDVVINSTNEYHKSMKKVDLRANVFENIILLFVILIPVIGMYALFRLKKKCLIGGQSKSNTMFSLLTVSLLMTTAEAIFVYWYNIQNTYNNINEKLKKDVGFKQYLSMKKMNNDIPNVVHTEFKKSYERNLQGITFIMLLPILLICIFMLSLLTGCMNIGYKDILAILINVLLLLVVFGVTFVNLGMKQSEHVNFKKIAESFDPFNDVHRFQTAYSFLSSRDVIGMFSGLMAGIIAFIAFVYKYK